MTAIERQITAAGERKFTYRLSLWAYAPAFLWLVTMAVVSPWIAALSFTLAAVLLAAAALFCCYQIWWLHSVELYADDDGVWVYRGVLPWARGVYGVRWWNLDEATYFTGFVSWATKSYRLQLTHRFTKKPEISLAHVAGGDEAVRRINELVQILRSRGDDLPPDQRSEPIENSIARAD